MNKRVLSIKLVALFLCFLMVFSSIGLSIDIHICQGSIKSVSFFGNKATCEMMKNDAKNKSFHCKMSKSKHCAKMGSKKQKDCCHNEKIEVKKVENISASSFKSFVSNEITIISFLLLPEYQNKKNLIVYNFRNYKPPLISKTDVFIEFQTFLI